MPRPTDRPATRGAARPGRTGRRPPELLSLPKDRLGERPRAVSESVCIDHNLYSRYSISIATGVLIREARLAEGLTQSQLARRLGISQPSVARMEAAGDELSVGTLRRALKAMGRTLEMRATGHAPSYDETLLRQNLALTPAERLDRMQQAQLRFGELAAATRRARDAL